MHDDDLDPALARADHVRTYPPAERPLVEVLVDDTWHPGELRMWTRHGQEWRGQVAWTKRPGSTHIDTFPADQIRPVPEE